MAYADGEGDFSPAASDCVDVGTADTAGVDGDIDVMVFEGLELELWWVLVCAK